MLNNLSRHDFAISELLEAPKAILNAGPWVVGAPDANHQEGHEGEEEGDDEAKPIDCLVSNHHCTVHLGFESCDCFLGCCLNLSYGSIMEYTLSTCTDFPLRSSNPGRL